MTQPVGADVVELLIPLELLAPEPIDGLLLGALVVLPVDAGDGEGMGIGIGIGDADGAAGLAGLVAGAVCCAGIDVFSLAFSSSSF